MKSTDEPDPKEVHRVARWQIRSIGISYLIIRRFRCGKLHVCNYTFEYIIIQEYAHWLEQMPKYPGQHK